MKLDNLKRIVGNGKIFAVDFIKRTDGSTRRMVARTGVSTDIATSERAYDPAERGLLPVYDMQKRAWRQIPADAVLRIKANGVEQKFGIAPGTHAG